VIYIAKGISFAPLSSNETAYLVAGDSSYSMTVNFDTNVCETKLTGALVYLEKDDATKEYVKASVINNLELVSGDNVAQDVDVLSAAKNTILGEVTFPDTIPGALIGAVLKVGEASVILDATYSLAVAGKKSYGFDVPVLAGVNYRTAAYAPNAGWTQLSFVYSEELNPGATNVNLSLPIVGGAVSPVSNIATITPTFNQRFVTGMNVYYSFVTNGANTYWFGTSSTNNTKMPAELPAPAQLQNANSYTWAGFTAIKVRNATGVNDLLDGRLVKGAYAQLSAWGNPDGVEMGMINLETKAFNILP
jgi:hypothetical protein